MRDGGGNYHTIVPDAISGTTISSADYNANLHDVANDLNFPRPILCGGTGASNAVQARDNLDCEVAFQQITNYDTAVFECGSFFSNPGAAGAPAAGYLHGVFVGNSTASTIVVINVSDTFVPHKRYTRDRNAGAWGPWSLQDNVNDKVNRAGDTMTGNLIINKSTPSIELIKTGDGQQNVIYGKRDSTARWAVVLGDTATDIGANVGSDFNISRYSDAGTFINCPIIINRATGTTTVSGNLSVGGSSIQIGQSSPPNAADILTRVGYSTSIALGFRPAGDGSYPCAFYNAADVLVGYINCTSTSTFFSTTSDARLKDDLQPFDAGPILDRINVYDFAWRSNGERAHGVVAQEATEVYPAAVTHDDTSDTYGVDYSKYVPLLLNEVKSLRTRVASLEKQIAGGT